MSARIAQAVFLSQAIAPIEPGQPKQGIRFNRFLKGARRPDAITAFLLNDAEIVVRPRVIGPLNDCSLVVSDRFLWLVLGPAFHALQVFSIGGIRLRANAF
jgi:hypothetical protein